MFGLCAFDAQALSAASKEMKTQFKKNKELDISYIDKMQDDMFDMMVRGMGPRGVGVVDLHAGLLVRGPRERSGVDLETHRRLPLHALATVHTFPTPPTPGSGHGQGDQRRHGPLLRGAGGC